MEQGWLAQKLRSIMDRQRGVRHGYPLFRSGELSICQAEA